MKIGEIFQTKKRKRMAPLITFKPVNIKTDEWRKFCKESEKMAERVINFVNRNYSP
jgi:hypothetical protein